MGTGDALAQHGRAGRLHSHHLDSGILALEILAHAGDRAAGADAGHKDVNLAVGISPNLRAGSGLVDSGVCGINELAGDKAARNLLRQLVGLGNGALHALGALGQHQLCAVGLHQLAALHTHGLRHDNNDAVAPGGGHRGKADTGVAGGGLDDDRTLLQQPLSLSIVDHGLGNTVLDGAGGIKVLQLGQKGGLKTQLLLNMGQLQQRSLADQLVCGSINVTHSHFLLIYKSVRFWNRIRG